MHIEERVESKELLHQSTSSLLSNGCLQKYSSLEKWVRFKVVTWNQTQHPSMSSVCYPLPYRVHAARHNAIIFVSQSSSDHQRWILLSYQTSTGLGETQYQDRPKKLDLPSLVYRRCRGDMMDVNKYLHGLYDVDIVVFLTTTGHCLKLQQQNQV